MNKFLVVFKFEMKNYFESKSYLLSTLLIALLLAIGIAIPSYLPNNPLLLLEQRPQKCYGIVDNLHIIEDLSVFEKKVPFSKMVVLDSRNELEEGIKRGSYDAGVEIISLTTFNYIVENTRIGDVDEKGFKEVVSELYREKQMIAAGIDYKMVKQIYEDEVICNRVILGKDGANNYVYTYILAFVIYMMVILHGQMIAVAITTEKSNRAMEILVTSTNANNLIFGKVLAGTVASFIQGVILLGTGMITYQTNADAWGHRLDFIFNIPGSVLLTFMLFGIMGFIFYAFIFGAMGALASRVEDVSKSISVITFIFIIVFIIGMYGMSHSESMMIKVASFVPFSSCIAMFIRVAMGNVSIMELDIAMTILVASTIIVGSIGSRVYRLGTMRYGKPIPLMTALSNIKNNGRGMKEDK